MKRTFLTFLIMATLVLLNACSRALLNYSYMSDSTPPLISYEPLASDPGEESEEFYEGDMDRVVDNPFLRVENNPLSTFSIDTDTACYSITRSYLNNGSLPLKSFVRIEELVNYFDYDYEAPSDDKPFSANTETGVCPWNEEHLLTRIALKGQEFPQESIPPLNLVFLIDVSGSMERATRLPLVKEAMKMLVDKLNAWDRVSLCVYADATGVVLQPTTCDKKDTIKAALDKLQAGGSTAGGAGITLAYKLAAENYSPNAINRVILCTDGDFNVGITNRADLIDLIQEKAASGVYLTVLGFGMDNYRESTLEQLADKGNGNYGYIDTIAEAKKLLVNGLSSTLVTIAKDVKIQVEFNPANVGAYRLIGYENRKLNNEDFNDDTVDAGEIGSGHCVTAFYELIPAGSPELDALPSVDPLKYGVETGIEPSEVYANELLSVKLRYKEPQGTTSKLLSFPVMLDSVRSKGASSRDFTFAAAVAGFGMLLRDSPYKGSLNYSLVKTMALANLGADPYGYRAEFIELVDKASELASEK